MIRKNIKLLIGIILGIISVGGVYAVSSLNANSITIDNSNMPKINGDKLNDALDYLYSQSEKTNMITIESGVKHLSQTYLGIVYLDPTNLNKKCSEADAKANRNQDGTITGVKTGCMKWYIYDEDSTNYKAILDHNTTAQVAWNSGNVNTSQKEVAITLTNDTAGWGTKGEEVIDLNPRLITANEVAKITGANTQINWNSDAATNMFYFDSKNNATSSIGQGTSEFTWLFDNVNSCIGNGCNTADSSNSWGYWTDTAYFDNNSDVWYVSNLGRLEPLPCGFFASGGIRPVITVSKSLFG